MTTFKLANAIALFTVFGIACWQETRVFAQQPVSKSNVQFGVNSELTTALGDYLVRIRLAGGMDVLAGMEVVPAEEVLRIQLGLADRLGLVVATVENDGPAAMAGIQVNDVLTTVESQDLNSVENLHQKLKDSKNKPVKISLIRAGQRQTVELTPRSPATDQVITAIDANQPSRYWLGVALAGADATLRSQLNIPEEHGLVVTTVEPDGPASKAGVMVNDVLLKLDGKTLKTIEEVVTNLQQIEAKSVTLELIRRGKPATLTVTPEKRPQGNANFNVQLQTPSSQALFFAIPEHGHLWAHNAGQPIPLGLRLNHAEWHAVNDSATNAGLDATRLALSQQLDKLLEQTTQLQASLNAMKAQLQTPATPGTPVTPKPTKP